jgi:hypothetical protein
MVLVAATVADAQPGGRGRGGRGGFMGRGGGMGGSMMGGGIAGLLRIEEVRKELKVTDEQETNLTELGEKLREEARERMSGMFGGGENLSREERMARFEKMREQFQKQAEEAGKQIEKQVAGVLDKGQFKRLKQIELQQQARRGGPAILMRDDIAKALKLSDAQKNDLRAVVESANKQREELRSGFGNVDFRNMSEDDRAKFRETMEKNREKGEQIRTDSQKKAMALLTDDQKTTLKKIMGKPFEMPERPAFGGRRGEGGQRGRPRGEGGRPRGEGGRPRGEGGRPRAGR